MNLKYYLRGLGIGVIVTALIMGITAGNSKETLSNDEIKERAKALGMVEETTLLSDALESAKPAEEIPTPEPSAEVTVEPTLSPTAKATAEPTEAPTAEPTVAPTAEPTTKPIPEPEAQPAGIVIIEVKSGEGSYTVCEKLEAAGLIASASDFDRYLGQKEYDRRIRTGKHEIPTDAEPEEIAKILAGE